MSARNTISSIVSRITTWLKDSLTSCIIRSRDKPTHKSSADSVTSDYQVPRQNEHIPNQQIECAHGPPSPKTFHECWTLSCDSRNGGPHKLHLDPSVHYVVPDESSEDEQTAISQMSKRLLTSMKASARNHNVPCEEGPDHLGRSKVSVSLDMVNDHEARRNMVAKGAIASSALADWTLAETITLQTADDIDFQSRVQKVFGPQRTEAGEGGGGKEGKTPSG